MMNKCLILTLLITNLFAQEVPHKKDITGRTVPDSSVVNFNPQVSDTLDFIDSTSHAIIRPDTLKPLFKSPLITNSVYQHNLSKSDIAGNDYRYAGNFMNQLPFGFLNDLGSMGAFNEPFLYGFGFDNISFVKDDIGVNNRLTNSLDLHLVQSEAIDSIYMFPLSRGFLITSDNNPVAVNIISRDSIDITPRTRIRYYQASNEEGFIDAAFSAYVTNRLNMSFALANMSMKDRFDNTEYGNWSGRIKLHYMPSNKLNLLANYNYSKSNTPLNGGVDYESIIAENTSGDVNETLYDDLNAPVIFANRYVKQTTNDFNIQLLGNFINNLPTTLSFYYQYALSEFRQNENGSSEGIENVVDNSAFEVYGIQLTQSFNSQYAFVDVTGNFENIKTDLPSDSTWTTSNKLSLSGIAGLKIFDSSITPSIFGKYLKIDENNYFGFGADINLALSENLSLYGGFSGFAKPYSPLVRQYFESDSKSSKMYIVEAGLKYQTEGIITGLSLVTVRQNDKPIAVGTVTSDSGLTSTVVDFFTKNGNRASINLTGSIDIYKFRFTTNLTYNIFEKETYTSIPDFYAAGGLYYINQLFDSNLHLKTGINYYLFGNRDYFIYDFEKSMAFNYFMNESDQVEIISNSSFDPKFRIDFFLAGTIQESATVYVVAENLLSTNYFIVPYYPMPSFGIRLGVSWELFN